MRNYLLLTVCLFSALLNAECAPSFYGYQFLDPTLVPYNSQLSPYYRYFRAYYPQAGLGEAEYQKTDNLEEWYERYCEQVAITDLEAIVYGNSEGKLQRLLRVMGQKKASVSNLPNDLRSNSFLVHLMRYRCTDAVEYILFAKACEPYVTRAPDGDEQTQTRRVRMEQLIDDGLDKFPRTESHYIRLRYAYQLLRLAHYLREYDYVLELYDYLMPKVEADPSLIYYWLEGHRAGALRATGRYAEAAYLYSRIFANCRSRRESAYNSFMIRTDEEWRAVSNHCQNDRERANLHVLRAQNRRAVVLEEMESIYLLDPDNAALEPLLMRELKELEADLLGLDFNPEKQTNREADRPRPGAARRLIDVQQFVNKVVRNGNARSPQLWVLARGVLEMLAGDYYYARRSFAEVRREGTDSLRAQARIFGEVTNVLALNRVTDSVEQYYFDLLDDDELREDYPRLRPLVNDKFEAVYYATGRKGKAGLLQYGFDAIVKNPELQTITELKNMGDSLLGNQFDRILLEERIGENAQDDVNHLLGLYYLQRGQWETALEVFRQIPTTRRDGYGRYAPFVKQFHDRVNFVPSATIGRYDKVQFLERLLELEAEARGTLNDTIATRNYFNIALAHYNMSYYSYNWDFADAFRSGSSGLRARQRLHPQWVFRHPDAPFGNKENFNMDRARYYFERALSRSPSREASAEAIYYAAKTERNQNYAAARPRSFGYFRLLRDNYADTKFYQRAVAECKTFAWYSTQ